MVTANSIRSFLGLGDSKLGTDKTSSKGAGEEIAPVCPVGVLDTGSPEKLFPEIEFPQAAKRKIFDLGVDVGSMGDWDATMNQYNTEIGVILGKEDGLWTLDSNAGRPACHSPGAIRDGKYELDSPPLRATHSSTIFTAQSKEDDPEGVVIKYTNNCSNKFHHSDNPEDLDELMKEYLIMRTLEGVVPAIAPRVFELSAMGQPDKFDWMYDERFKSSVISDSSAAYTCRGLDSKVRGIVEEKFQSDLFEYMVDQPRGKARVIELVTAGLKTIERLQQFHAKGYIHGDIHHGNVALKNDDMETIILIDFGYSKFFPSEIGQETEKPKKEGLNLSLLTHWHLEDSRIGRRDDIFRAIEMIASLLSLGYRHELDKCRNSIDDLSDLKLELDFFHVGGERDRSPCLYDLLRDGELAECTRAMASLTEALSIIRSTPHVDSRPDYEAIINKFTNALGILGPVDKTLKKYTLIEGPDEDDDY